MNFSSRFVFHCAGLCLWLACIGMAGPAQAADRPIISASTLLKANTIVPFGVPQLKSLNINGSLGAPPLMQNAGSLLQGSPTPLPPSSV
ncbi:MAG: hypothetical protein JWR15_3388, partial [Prosthecobacter sp.]|nr:hypothetical protein [Prosthecobacter sp.]